MPLPIEHITIEDVRIELTASTTELGDLCRHSSINKWSKYKPVVYNIPDGFEDPNWYRGENGMCGLGIQGLIFYSLNDLKSRANVNAICNGMWYHIKPEGLEDEPFRLADFRGYDHQAEKFIAWPATYNLNTFYNAGNPFYFTMYYENGYGVSENIQMEDMIGMDWDNTYLVAVIFRGTTWYGTYQAEYPMSEQGMVWGNLTTIPNSYNYEVFLMMRNITNNRFMPLPDSRGNMPIMFRKAYDSPLTFVDLQMSWAYNGTFKDWSDIDFDENGMSSILHSSGGFTIKARVYNSSDQDVTINKTALSFVGVSAHGEYYQNQAVTIRIAGTSVNSFTVPANGYIDLAIEPVNPVLLYDGSGYSIITDLAWPEIALIHNVSIAQTIISVTIRFQYNGTDGWD